MQVLGLLHRKDQLVRLALLCGTIGLTGCSLAPLVSNESIDYNRTVEDVSTTVLITNILRARDHGPLFFSDLSQLRGSFNLSLAAQAAFPFGPINRPLTASGVRDIGTIGPLSFANNPSFDEAPLTTKQFTQGILNSVNETLIAYYVQRVSAPGPFLDLFFSQIDSIDGSGAITRLNNSRDSGLRESFFRLLTSWIRENVHHPLKIVAPSREAKFGPAVKINADTLIKAKAASLDVRPLTGDMVQLVEKSPVVTLCVPNVDDTDYIAVGLVSISVQKPLATDAYQDTNANCRNHGDPRRPITQATRYEAHVRSVQGIFYYLGYILNNQDPILPFSLPTSPSGGYRIAVPYRGDVYYLPRDELTLAIIAVLNDIVNINRTPDELPKTTAVQAVGG